MGNSRWRLETALNYVAQNIHELGRVEDVEVLVADWGSEISLREVLKLSPAAARIVSFILIPPEIAFPLQKDSPFPEVLALNAAARRARGDYIGRIDQDTLVGKRFLEIFFELYEGNRRLKVPLEAALLFANRRDVPYRFAVRSPSFRSTDRFVHWFGRFLRIEVPRPPIPFYLASVGIWLVNRTLWNECGGYDERMIYMNAMETNMIVRLMMRYEMVNLGALTDYDFYHLEHYDPRAVRKSSTYRKVNPNLPFSRPDVLNPNNQDWGLIQYPLERLSYSGQCDVKTATCRQRLLEFLGFTPLLLVVGPLMGWDGLTTVFSTWRRRAGIAKKVLYGQPLVTWPHLLRKVWLERKPAKMQ